MKQGLAFLAVLVLAALAFFYSLSPKFPVSLGLDLKGGMRVALEPDYPKIAPEDRKSIPSQMSTVRDVLENRVNTFGLSGSEVRQKGDQQILVLLPGVKDPDKVLGTMLKVAQMEFRHLQNVDPKGSGRKYTINHTKGDASKGEPDTYKFTDTATGKPVPEEQVIKDSPKILDGKYLKATSRAEINPTTAEVNVTFEFNQQGADQFGKFTTDNRGELLAIVLDNHIISAPTIDEPITEGKGIIRGGFANMQEARTLANLMNSGALPIPLKPAETEIVGATLGQESINQSVRAGAIGLGLVLLFMVLYYHLPGFIACVALLIYSALTFWIFKGLPFVPGQTSVPPIVLDLPGITGFILSVGMAVDANILIFERLKEELRSGKTLHAAVDAGFKRAFTSIFDSNVTTWIVCAVLIWLGRPMIKGFAITLAIGVAVSMFTAITVTRTILHLMMEGTFARNERLYGLNSGWLQLVFPQFREGGVLRVFEKRKAYLGFSAALSIIAAVFILLSFTGHGLQPGIDFTGGTSIEAAFNNPNVSKSEVEQALAGAGVKGATVAIAKSQTPWTRVHVEANDVDQATQKLIPAYLGNANVVKGFDASTYDAKVDGKTVKIDATYTTRVTEADVRRALDTKPNPSDVALGLKGVKITTTDVSHQGPNAVPIALILSHQLPPEQVTEAKAALSKLGGGIVEPMYQQSSIGPSVASEVTWNGISSVIVASLFIIGYLAFRFAIGGFINGLKFGTCAVIALIHDVGIIIGLFAVLGATLHWQVDSLFITACLTVLGFSVHDTIVVYDRIRENLIHRRKGETFADVSDRSITQTFDRSINTSFTVLLVVAALAIFGGASVRQFNVALLCGIAIGTYSSIFVASPLVVMWERMAAAREGTAPASATAARPARQDAALRPSRPRETPVRPATTPRTDGAAARTTESAAREEEDMEARPASGAVRPRKKRRM